MAVMLIPFVYIPNPHGQFPRNFLVANKSARKLRTSRQQVNDVTRKLRGTGPSGIWPCQDFRFYRATHRAHATPVHSAECRSPVSVCPSYGNGSANHEAINTELQPNNSSRPIRNRCPEGTRSSGALNGTCVKNTVAILHKDGVV